MATLLPAALFLLATVTFESRAATVTLDSEDPRLEWTPARILGSSDCKGQPGNELCTGSWWLEGSDAYYNRTARLTWGPSTTVRFTFRGSLFTIYGSTLTSGASASVQVDQDPLFFFSTDPGRGVQGKSSTQLYSRSGLDPNAIHDVLISYDAASNGQTAPNNRKWLIIDSILIEEVAEATGTTPPSDPTSSSPASPQRSNQPGGLSTAASAGIGVGVGVLAAAILLVLFLLRRRHRRQRVDIDGSTTSYIAPTSTSGAASMSQRQWAAPWQPESIAPSSIPPSSVVSNTPLRQEEVSMPPAYTAIGRMKN